MGTLEAASNHEGYHTTASGAQKKELKPERFSLIPVPALTELARLYGFGATKYAAHNWRKGVPFSISYDAAQRHLTAFWDGQDRDPETRALHVINAAFHMFALATEMIEQTDAAGHNPLDDRPYTQGFPRLGGDPLNPGTTP